ncbi:glycoprotein hormone beta-5-like [Colossoma macropomum]|uniref:glycoprotein hormone beta-5-like n=1 Tax=Colossoma macropomum TaxID=42526 RepID=UPI00186555B9|nr:glycoprotein hormone beta-5-like [Colossoma macropomum]
MEMLYKDPAGFKLTSFSRFSHCELQWTTQFLHTGSKHDSMSLSNHPLTSVTFVLLVAGVAVAVTTLHSFRGCAVRDFSFVAQKPGCKSLRIHTEACWGRCHTWERPVPEPPFIQRHHRVCTYSRWHHMTSRLPGCLPGISPLYHYPQALQCECNACSSHYTECEAF